MTRLPTLIGENRPDSDSPMLTEAGARRYGERLMPADLRAAGFTVDLYRATREVNGWDGWRVSYGKRVTPHGLFCA